MQIDEVDHYLFITIESHDWRTFARRFIEVLKKIPGSLYIFQTKCWRIEVSQKHLVAEYLPPFTIEEELEGDRQLKTFLHQFDSDIAYSP